jgi:Ca-activated chloride channel family protein
MPAMRNAYGLFSRRALITRFGVGAALLALALALSLSPAEVRAAGLLLADGGFGGALDIEEHSVRVTINNGIAVTETTQVFRNRENRQVEALYVFPVPKGASVADFTMWINDREMTGEVLEKKRAREIYESYKRTRQDPGLLEQVDYKTFELRIFPIGPKAAQRVRVVYYQELDFDDDWANYVYPLATVARQGVNPKVTGRFAFSLQVRSEAPIVAIESPSHPQEFLAAARGASYAEATLEATGGDLSRDLVIAYQAKRPQTGLDLIASRRDGEDGYFCMTLSLGEELDRLRQGMDYVFVLDVSGSMANDGKLIISREAVGAFLRSLAPEDRFEVIAFNTAPELLFQKLEAASAANIDNAMEFLGSKRAIGGTVLRSALQTAYRYGEPDRPLNVVVLSDGIIEQGTQTELLGLIAQRPSHAKVFCVGVGNELNRPLLDQVAKDSGGLAAFISREDNFSRQAQAFRRKLTRPAGVNLSIGIEGVETYDIEPQRLPNLYHGMPIRVCGRYKSGGAAQAILRAEVDGQPLKKAFDLSFPDRDDNNAEIERVWASRRVERLLADADRAGNRPAAVDEVVRLGEAYSIVTEYTSFLVLENDAEYKRWKIERRNALRSESATAQRQKLLAEFERIRDKELAGLGPIDPDAKPALERVTTVAAQPARLAEAPPSGWERDPEATRSRRWSPPDLPSFGGGGGGGGGGGALDPASAGLALLFGAVALSAARRRRKER